MTPKTQATKGKIHKLDFIKIKNVPPKDTIKRVIKITHEWEKIFSNHIVDKELIPKLYKGMLQLNNKKCK